MRARAGHNSLVLENHSVASVANYICQHFVARAICDNIKLGTEGDGGQALK